MFDSWLLGGALVASGPAAFAGEPTSLRWLELPGAEACGDAIAVVRAIEERVGHAVLVPAAGAGRSIEARIEHADGPPHWIALVTLRDDSGSVLGTRRFQSDARTCDALRDAAVLGIALMLDADASPDALSVPSRSSGAAPAMPALAIDDARSATEVPRPPPWRFESAASFGLGFGLLPSTAAGVRVGLAVDPPSFWRIEVFGGTWLSQEAPAEQGARWNLSRYYVAVVACPIRLGRDGTAAFDLCAGPQGTWDRARSSGFAVNRPSSRPGLDAVVDAALVVPLVSGLGLRMGAQLGLAVARDQVLYEDASGRPHVLFDPPITTIATDLGVAVRLP